MLGGLGILGLGWGFELFNVGNWLAKSDEVLETKVDFLAATELRLVPATTRSERKKLLFRNVTSIWTLACQETVHVGHAGVGIVFL